MSSTSNNTEHHLDSIRNGNSAIGGLTKLLNDFSIDDAGGNEIPETIKSGYIKGCLVAAIQIIAESTDYHIDELDSLLDPKKKTDKIQ
jgi:hypothetical protein